MDFFGHLPENVNLTVTKKELLELIEFCLHKNLNRQTKQLPEHFNLKQLSEYINYSEPAIYKMVSNAEIPCYKRSGKYLFKKTEIDHWLLQFQQPTIKDRIDSLNIKCK